MKRFSLVLVCIALCIPPLVSRPLLQTERGTIGMGSAGVALSASPSSFFFNPALLYSSIQEKGFFTLSGSYNDSIRPANFSDNVQNPLMQEPFSHLSVSFSGSNVALTIQNQISLNERVEESTLTSYSGLNHTLFQLDWATGRSFFAFGLNVKALAVSKRNPIEIQNDRVISDLILQTSLGKFDILEDEASISVGMGLLLDYDWFKMGIVSDTFAFAKASDSLQISADEIFKTLDWGFSFSSPTYDSNNLLHLFKFQLALDFVDLGSEETRELRTGFDLKLQLLPTWSVSLKSGYKEKKELPSDLFQVDLSQGTHTLGLSAQLDAFTLDLACEIPMAWYLGGTDDESVVEAVLAISFSI